MKYQIEVLALTVGPYLISALFFIGLPVFFGIRENRLRKRVMAIETRINTGIAPAVAKHGAQFDDAFNRIRALEQIDRLQERKAEARRTLKPRTWTEARAMMENADAQEPINADGQIW